MDQSPAEKNKNNINMDPISNYTQTQMHISAAFSRIGYEISSKRVKSALKLRHIYNYNIHIKSPLTFILPWYIY